MTTTYFIVPGYGDSGPTHWQTIWQQRNGWRRIQQDDWNNPEPQKWARRIQGQVMAVQGDVVIVAHSLGCLAFALAFSELKERMPIKGALLVAPPDPFGSEFPKSIRGTWTTNGVIPCKSIVVCSSSDPYATVEYSQHISNNWGSQFICIGDAGHINSTSNLGNWDYGYSLLEGLS